MNEIRFWRAVVSLIALGAALLFFFSIWNVLLPFFFGLIIAYLVSPLVDAFSSTGLKRSRVVIILYVVLLAGSVMLGNWLFPRLYQEANLAIEDLPAYATSLNNVVNSLNSSIQDFLGRFIGTRAEGIMIPFKAEKLLESLFHSLPANLMNVAHAGLWIFIIPFVSFFALSQGEEWVDLLFDWTPSQYVENLLGLLAEINTTLGGYIRGLFLESLCVGALTIVGLLLFGVKGAILIGFVTALLNMVPFMALLVGGSLALLAGFYQGLSLSIIFGIFFLYIGVRVIDDFVIIPFVLGHNVKVHPILMLFAVLAGVQLGGFLGLVFAIPIAAVIKVVLSITLRNRRDNMFPVKQHVYS